MDDSSKRQEGMMFLEDREVKPDEGMLFVFRADEPGTNGFWMQNTLIPLDIIYIDQASKVIEIAAGKVLDESPLPPKKPYRYVVELKQGEAAKAGITVGTSIKIPKVLTASE